MGVTVFKFAFNGSKEQFLERVRDWIVTTTEGQRYKVKKPSPGTILMIQRGVGAITAPIIMEFKVGSELGLSTEMLARGYVRAFAIGRFKKDLRPDAIGGGLPRRNGWKDMLKILDFAGVDQYQHRFE